MERTPREKLLAQKRTRRWRAKQREWKEFARFITWCKENYAPNCYFTSTLDLR